MNKITKNEASQVALRAADAYSRNRYTDAGWAQIASKLAEAGFTANQIEVVLRSKHMRWAADEANRSHSATAKDFFNYLTKNYGGPNTPKFLAALPELKTADTDKMTGADLAGFCEGEDIAALIELARQLRERQGGLTIYGKLATDILAVIERRAK